MLNAKNNIFFKEICLKDLPESITVPNFQRGISWSSEQAEIILNEFETLLEFHEGEYASNPLYLSEFVGYSEMDKFKLADGQQRFLFTLLLKRAVIEYCKEKGISTALTNSYISYEDVNEQNKWEKFQAGKPSGNIKKLYNCIQGFVKEHDDKISDIEQILNNAFIHLKTAANADIAYNLFTCLNASGKLLSKEDVIKSCIVQNAEKYKVDISISRNKLKDFLIAYIICSCQEQISSFDPCSIMTFMNCHVTNSKESIEKFKAFTENAKTLENTQWLSIANQLGRNQLNYMVYLIESNGFGKKEKDDLYRKVFIPMCIASIVSTLSNINPGGWLKKFFDNTVQKIKNKASCNDIQKYIFNCVDQYKDTLVITKAKFSEYLQGNEKHNRTNIYKTLLELPLVSLNTSGCFLPDKINLEHIYPQEPSPEWSTVGGWTINQDEQEALSNDFGNVILLNEHVNKKIKNEYIDKKKIEYEKIFAKDAMLNVEFNKVDFDRFASEKGEYIKERRERNIDIICDTVPFAKILIKD